MRYWLAALPVAVILAAAAFLYLSQGRVDVYVDPPAPGLAIYLTFTSVALGSAAARRRSCSYRFRT
jgi:hypothetical protein